MTAEEHLTADSNSGAEDHHLAHIEVHSDVGAKRRGISLLLPYMPVWCIGVNE